MISSVMKMCTEFPLSSEDITGGSMKLLNTLIMTREDSLRTKPVEDFEWLES